MFVDSHCHLSFPGLHERIGEVLEAMSQARVDRALCICTTLEEFDTVHALATQHPGLWATAGVHPDNEGVREPQVEDLIALAARPRVVAIGETGLDYYRLGGRSVADMAWQRERFRVHIRAARATREPRSTWVSRSRSRESSRSATRSPCERWRPLCRWTAA
jgi:TatD DNase family protein